MDSLDRRVNETKPRQPLTVDSLIQYAQALQPLIAEYSDLLADAEMAYRDVRPVDDADVRAEWRVLIQRMRNSRDGLAAATDDLRQHRFQEFSAEVKARKAETDRLDAKFRDLANRINDRYSR